MGELLKIQNDILFTCMLISFIALMWAGFKVAMDLYTGKEVDYKIFNWLGAVAIILGFSYMLTAFLK